MKNVEFKTCPVCNLQSKRVEIRSNVLFFVNAMIEGTSEFEGIMYGDYPGCGKCQTNNESYVKHLKENNKNLIKESLYKLKFLSDIRLERIKNKSSIIISREEVDASIKKFEEILNLKTKSAPKQKSILKS